MRYDEIEKAREYFLFQLEKEWNSLLQFEKNWESSTGRISSRPWGVWVREYGNAVENCEGFSDKVIPKLVWFLDKSGYRKKDISEFQRFLVVHSQQPWCGKVFRETSNTIWSGGDKVFHEIGMASFAKIESTVSSYYCDYIWGGRFGRAYRVELDENPNRIIWKTIWVS